LPERQIATLDGLVDALDRVLDSGASVVGDLIVLALAEAVRELLERQAVRRIETGDLTPEQVERLGRTLLAVRQQLTAVREQLEIETNRKDTT